MHFLFASTGALSAFLALTVVPGRRHFARAQSLEGIQDLPPCGASAVLDAFTASGCPADEPACFCDQPQALTKIFTDVQAACNEADQAKFTTFGANFCGVGGSSGSAESDAAPAPESTESAAEPAPEPTAQDEMPADSASDASYTVSCTTIMGAHMNMTPAATPTASVNPTGSAGTTASDMAMATTNSAFSGAAEKGMSVAALVVAIAAGFFADF